MQSDALVSPNVDIVICPHNNKIGRDTYDTCYYEHSSLWVKCLRGGVHGTTYMRDASIDEVNLHQLQYRDPPSNENIQQL